MIFNLSNCKQNNGSGLRNITIHLPFVFAWINTNLWLSGWDGSKSPWVGRHGFYSCRMLKLLAALLLLCVALSPSVDLHARFLFCCALYYIFPIKFRQWLSRADLVLTLNMNIRLSLFWSTWSRHLESGLGHGLSHICWPGAWWVISADYSNCIVSEQ